MGVVWYGNQALRGWARAMQHLYRVPIKIDVGQSPYTDGKTVFLPPCAAKTVSEFEASLGTGAHEMSHVKFETVEHLKKYMTRHKLIQGAMPDGSPKMKPCGEAVLRREAFNFIVDLADETRFERIDVASPRMRELFRRSFTSAVRQGLIAKAYDQGNAPPYWQLMAMTMTDVRAYDNQPLDPKDAGSIYISDALWKAKSQMVANGLYLQVEDWRLRRVMARAVTGKRQKVKRPDGKRSHAQWRRLYALTDELYDLLKHLKPPDQQEGGGSGEEQQEGESGDQQQQGGGGSGSGQGQPDPNSGTPLDGGMSDQRSKAHAAPSKCKREAGDSVASEEDGAAAAKSDCGYSERDAEHKRLHPPSKGAGGGQGRYRGRHRRNRRQGQFNRQLYTSLRPIFKTMCQELAECEEGRTMVGGYRTGVSLSQPHRLMTDGKAFTRWSEGREVSAAVCLLLDISGSMSTETRLPVAAAACKAFAEAMQHMAEMRIIAFESDYEDVAIEDLDTLWCRGGTSLTEPMREAVKWLDKFEDESRKFIILLTDGMPYNPESVQEQIQRCHRMKGKVVVFADGLDMDEVKRNLPRCHYGNVTNRADLVRCLKRVARMAAM